MTFCYVFVLDLKFKYGFKIGRTPTAYRKHFMKRVKLKNKQHNLT